MDIEYHHAEITRVSVFFACSEVPSGPDGYIRRLFLPFWSQGARWCLSDLTGREYPVGALAGSTTLAQASISGFIAQTTQEHVASGLL
jgi:hypothetical protein